jgi:plastocyanin
MKKQILSLTVLLLLSATSILVSCGKSNGGYNSPAPPAPSLPANTVGMSNMAFGPLTLTVQAGTTVTWQNNDNMAHTVTADDNSFDSGNLAVGAKFTHLFATAGTIAYHCTIHANMKASIIVNP